MTYPKKHTPRVGAHMSIAGGLFGALTRGAEAGCDIIQLFTRSSQQWAAKPITDADLEAWQTARADTGVEPAMAHTSYLLNLGAADKALWTKSWRGLVEELKRCRLLDIPYLVLHPGAHMGTGEPEGIKRVAAALDRVHDALPDCSTKVLLENTAGQGTSLGCKFSHLRDIIGAVAAPQRLGLCIDTCHLLAAGYDIRTAAAWQATFAELDSVIGCDRVRAFHVNDSKKPLGSRVDRHEQLGRGFVGLTAFRMLVNDPRFVDLPMSIETPKVTEHADLINLAILRALAGKSRIGSRARGLATQPIDAAPQE